LKIINPRGFRAYVRNDTVFRSIPSVINGFQEVNFIFPGMADEAQAQNWVKEMGIQAYVELLPHQSQEGMVSCFSSRKSASHHHA
jgi:hypothetical protein